MVEIDKPDDILLKLYDLVKGNGRFEGLLIDDRQTGTDTSETYWILIYYKQVEYQWKEVRIEYLASEVSKYFEAVIDYSSVIRIKDHYLKQVHRWFEYAKKNKKELNEYRRLKEKFGNI